MGRINIEIPDETHRKIKSVCALDGIILADFVNSAMEERITKFEKKTIEKRGK